MYRNDDATTAAAPDAVPGAGTEKYFTEGNPATGVVATKIPAWWLNQIQEELRNVVVAAGNTPTKGAGVGDWDQVAESIQDLIAAKYYAASLASPDLISGAGFANAYVSQGIRRISESGAGGGLIVEHGLPNGADGRDLVEAEWVGQIDALAAGESVVIEMVRGATAGTGGGEVMASVTYTGPLAAVSPGAHALTVLAGKTILSTDSVYFLLTGTAITAASGRSLDLVSFRYRT